MRIEYWILASVYIISIVALILLHRKKPLETDTVFLFHQLPTWILGLMTVQFGLIKYPVREFQISTHTSFAFEFLVYPVIACYFIIFYPENSKMKTKLLYYTAFSLGITITEILIEKYTQLIKYINWSWYWTFISVWITFYISLTFYRWFFAHKRQKVLG